MGSRLWRLWSEKQVERAAPYLMVCPDCHGTGEVEFARPDSGLAECDKCRTCGGRGTHSTDEGAALLSFLAAFGFQAKRP